MKAITQKFKNKRIILGYSEETDSFVLQFKRLKYKDEAIDETPPLSTCRCQVFRNKMVVTSLVLTREAVAGLIMILGSEHFNELT